MVSTSSDFPAILAAARRGDDEAWRVLYLAHASPVLGYLRSQRAPHAEDLLGETWLQAVRDIARFEGDESGFRSWLLTIAHHRLLDARRSARRRPAELQGVDVREFAPSERESIDETLQVEAEQQLQHLLADIPERQRTVLYLRFVLDMSQREVAQVLGLSTPAMKMLQLRATRTLARRVEALRAGGNEAPALPADDARRLGE